MQSVDLIIHSRWLLPIEPHGAVLDRHAVAIDQGKIIAILPSDRMKTQYRSESVMMLDDHVVLPGLVNTHTHSPMTLFRGLADDLPLMDWLNNHIWPAEKKWLNETFITDGTELAIAEMLRSGTTCFNEHYFYPDLIAQSADTAGMRACIGVTIIEFPTPWATSADVCIDKALAAHKKIDAYPLIKMSLAPHAPYTVSDATFKKIKALSDKHDFDVHIHTHETAEEINMSLETFGKRPLARLAELDLLSPRLKNVHMTQINDEDIALLKSSAAQVVTCPESNLKLASGFCPVQKLLDAGINVALGTDGAASNNDLDMFTEMRSMALIAKAVTKDLTAIDAPTALRIATLNGAKLLGLADKIGSIEVGKSADLIAVDLSSLTTQPVYNPISQLVYATNSRQVSHVWVNGKILVKDKQLTTLDVDTIKSKVKAWRDRIQRPIK